MFACHFARNTRLASKLTPAQISQRLMTPQMRNLRKHRKGLEDYDAQVEAGVVAAGKVARMAGVQHNR